MYKVVYLVALVISLANAAPYGTHTILGSFQRSGAYGSAPEAHKDTAPVATLHAPIITHVLTASHKAPQATVVHAPAIVAPVAVTLAAAPVTAAYSAPAPAVTQAPVVVPVVEVTTQAAYSAPAPAVTQAAYASAPAVPVVEVTTQAAYSAPAVTQAAYSAPAPAVVEVTTQGYSAPAVQEVVTQGYSAPAVQEVVTQQSKIKYHCNALITAPWVKSPQIFL